MKDVPDHKKTMLCKTCFKSITSATHARLHNKNCKDSVDWNCPERKGLHETEVNAKNKSQFQRMQRDRVQFVSLANEVAANTGLQEIVQGVMNAIK